MSDEDASDLRRCATCAISWVAPIPECPYCGGIPSEWSNVEGAFLAVLNQLVRSQAVTSIHVNRIQALALEALRSTPRLEALRALGGAGRPTLEEAVRLLVEAGYAVVPPCIEATN